MTTLATTPGTGLGTAEPKLALVDERSAVVATKGAPLTVSRPHGTSSAARRTPSRPARRLERFRELYRRTRDLLPRD
jgi:hypothetical protein